MRSVAEQGSALCWVQDEVLAMAGAGEVSPRCKPVLGTLLAERKGAGAFEGQSHLQAGITLSFPHP